MKKKDPFWCKHMSYIWERNPSTSRKNAFALEMVSNPWMPMLGSATTELWEFCPICGEKRPK